MIYRKNFNRKLWLPYLKTYEDFNKKIPDELKELFTKVRNIIGNPTSSFNKSIDLKEMGFCDVILNIKVIFNKLMDGRAYYEKDIIYYSNININDLLKGEDIIEMPIRIDDINININKLISVISHEIRHVYDIYTINNESDMKSFVDSYNYGYLKKLEKNDDFKYFLYLVYLSLEHELIARNTMIWEMFMDCHCSKEELYKLFENSSVYKSFEQLNTFNYNNLLDLSDIKDKINNFIEYFKGNICHDTEDVKLFFQNWDKYFKQKSSEYLAEGYLVLDDLFELINEKYEHKKIGNIKNVKEMLLEIHDKYIFKKELSL